MKRMFGLAVLVGVFASAINGGCYSGCLYGPVPDTNLATDQPSTDGWEHSDDLAPGTERTFAGIEMVWIPPGTFTMGSPVDEKSRHSGEDPQRQVKISRGFWLGKYPLTQVQWETVMGYNPSHFKGDESLPVECVSWDICQEFIRTLNSKGQDRFRLPTEAEWEYACRAGTTTRFYWGDDPDETQIKDYAWYAGNSGGNSGLRTQPVGQKKPNNWGLYDMSGNVYEWCHDWMDVYPSEDATDPKGPNSGDARVRRGGSFVVEPQFCRSANRLNYDILSPDASITFTGLRVVQSL